MKKILSIRFSIGGQAFKIFFALFLVWVFFSSIGFAACTVDSQWFAIGWTRTDNPTTCIAWVPKSNPAWFDNNFATLNSDSNLKKFIISYWLTSINTNCFSNISVIRSVQTKLKSLGVGCDTCIDGRYWTDTIKKVSNPACLPVCVAPEKDLPDNGQCPDCYKLIDWCCVPETINPTTTITPKDWSFNDLIKDIDVSVDFGRCIDLTNKLYDCSKIIVDNVDGAISWALNLTNQCIASFKPKEAKDINISVPEWTMFYLGWIKNVIGSAIIKYWAGKNCSTSTEAGDCKNKQVCSCESSNKKWNCSSQQCVCVNSPTAWTCPDWQEIYDGCCVAKCWDGQIRNDKWKCVCDPLQWCCGIKLNTNVPFIGNCIQLKSSNDNTPDSTDPDITTVNETTAFPILMQWLMKILVTVILVASFIILIAAWVMMSASGLKDEYFTTWRKMITWVIVALALLGASWVILRLVNPNFFG